MSAAFTFDAAKHEYRVGAATVPGCTSILSSGGLVAARFVNLDAFEHKGDLGREVHRACHLHNLGTLGEYDERVKPHLHACIRFKETCKSFKLISSEYQCVATIHGMTYGMKIDCNALVDGADTVIEWKIGKVYPHHGVQLAGYAAGLPHRQYTAPLARFMARKRIVVELRANGIPKVHTFEKRSDYDVFQSSLYTTSWKRQYGKFYEEKNA